jgi:hypothetical protein
MEAFTNYNGNLNITTYDTTTNFTNLRYFDAVVINGTTLYYLMSYLTNKIIIFDADWIYHSFQPFNSTGFCIKTIKNYLYISSNFNIYKTDLQLNIIKSVYANSSNFRECFYHSESDTLYLAGYGKLAIYAYDLDLNLLDIIDVSPNKPASIGIYNNKMFIGANTNSTCKVLVVQNKIITDVYVTSITAYIVSIFIDSFGYMSLASGANGSLLLYNTDGTNTGLSKRINTVYGSRFDSKNRFIAWGPQMIQIYSSV